MPEEQQETLTLDKLSSMDKPALYALAIMATKSMQSSGVAIFAVDMLGRIQIMPLSTIEFKSPPKVSSKDLNSLSQDLAIQIMVAQGDTDEQVVDYLKSREQ